MTVTFEPLDVSNWLKICDLSVSEDQKQIFPIPNVYWIGISRYEEHSKLFAIKYDDAYAGFIGGGLDEDGICGYINPLMIDRHFQNKGIAAKAMPLMMHYLIAKHHVPCIHINHGKTNHVAGRLYERLGFSVYAETEDEFCRSYPVNDKTGIFSLRDFPHRADECRKLLLEHFHASAAEHPAQVLAGSRPFPQGYFMLKNDRVVGWTGLHEKEMLAGTVYGWEGTLAKDKIDCNDLSPWITPLLVHPDARGNQYGKRLLDYARKEAGRMGFHTVYLTTGEIGYYEKYGFREVGLAAFTWGRPTKIYECSACAQKRENNL